MNDTIEVTLEQLIAFAEECWREGMGDGCSGADSESPAEMVSRFFNVEIPKADDPTPAPEPKPLTPLQEMLRDIGRQMLLEQSLVAPLVKLR